MSAVKPLGKHFDKICDSQGTYLRYRVGMIYPRDEGPKNASGTMKLKPNPGTAPIVKKFYLPPQDVELGSLRLDEPGTGQLFVYQAKYPVPESVRKAPYGELLLAIVSRPDKPSPNVNFGRFGEKEKKPFTFNTEKRQYMIPLRIYRSEENKFNPLYMRVERQGAILYSEHDLGTRPPQREEGEVTYSVFDLEWKNNVITVTLLPMEKSDVPEFLANL